MSLGRHRVKNEVRIRIYLRNIAVGVVNIEIKTANNRRVNSVITTHKFN